MFPASKEQFAFLPLRTNLLQHHTCRREHDRIDLASTLRTYSDASHAGDARLFIHLFGIFFVDGLYGTFRSTHAAPCTLLGGLGHYTGSFGFLVRTITGNHRF